MDDKKYNIIREQGEFMDPVPLTPQDNQTVVEATEQDSTATTPINE